MTELIRKDVQFKWEERQQAAFEKLKEILCSEQVLAYPDFNSQFILTTDASNTCQTTLHDGSQNVTVKVEEGLETELGEGPEPNSSLEISAESESRMSVPETACSLCSDTCQITSDDGRQDVTVKVEEGLETELGEGPEPNSSLEISAESESRMSVPEIACSLCSDTCHMTSDDGRQDVTVKVEEGLETEVGEGSEPISFPEIKAEPQIAPASSNQTFLLQGVGKYELQFVHSSKMQSGPLKVVICGRWKHCSEVIH